MALGVRVGVNTGEVVAGRESSARGELVVSGDAVNVAARLQQAAEPGEVVAGARTRRASEAAIDYGPERVLAARGKPDGVAAGVARGPRGDGRATAASARR